MSEAAAERPVRILCIAGSPRRRGNSDKLCDAAVKGVRDAGAEPIKRFRADNRVQFCQGCNGCSVTGKCVIEGDGMEQVYADVDSADGFIIATPIYFATVPASLKAIIDRFQPYWARRYVLGIEPARRRPGGIIVAGSGGDNPYGTECVFKPIRSVFGMMGVDTVDEMTVLDVDGPLDIDTRADALERARELGAAVAREAIARVASQTASDAG